MPSIFIETQFPTNISRGASGGPSFSTDIVISATGYEKRNINWLKARGKYEVSHAVRTVDEYKQLLAFFNMVKGRAVGFRFKDWLDFQSASTEGRLLYSISEENKDSLLNTTELGYKTYQLNKLYKFNTVTSDYYFRPINKPVSGTITIYRNGSPISVHGSDPSTINNIDYTTGIVTFNPKNTFNIESPGVTKGTTTTVALDGNQTTNIAIGDKVYFSSAATITELQNTYHTVSAVGAYDAGNTRTTITLSTNSTSYTGTMTSGNLYKYEQSASNFLTWTGDFDVPARFDIDHMQASYDTNISNSWNNIPIVELRL